ncbi:MAG TPA: threonine/serine dehydratase [Nitrososphaerales archaeon]|nr:threonine/serine dehydratase [Nitrososphaerales archaeon]
MVRLSQPKLPSLRDVESAEGRIREYFAPTPLEYSKGVSELLGREVYLKLETALPIRVFKLRGALNKLQTLPESALRRGVITASSGNHGFAIAYVSKLLNVGATICVPENVNPQKLKAIEEQGAEIIRHGKGYDEAYEHALATARERGLTFIHAFNDPEIIAGQGTCGLEITRQLPSLDAAVVAIGGGGLISGVAIALKGALPHVRVYGAETVAIPSMYESLERGSLFRVQPKPTIADGMQAAIPGELTFESVRTYVDKVGLVNDAELEDAIYELLTLARVLAEPAGASPLAVMKGSLKGEPGQKLVLVISGGNISVDLLRTILTKRTAGGSRGPGS